MNFLNRHAVIIKWKTPYIDWANSFDDDGLKINPNDPDNDTRIYLLPEIENIGNFQKSLKKFHLEIFKEELSSWMQDETTWPQDRSFDVFKQWFSAEYIEMVADLAEGHLELEEL